MTSPIKSTMLEIHLLGLDDMRRKWAQVCGLGVMLILLGIVALVASAYVTLATMIFFGCLMVAGGLMQTAHAMTMRAWSGFYIDLLGGVLNFVVGGLIVLHPGATAVALTLLIAVLFVIGGCFRVLIGIFFQYQHRLLMIAHGAINLLLGVAILQDWPTSGLWVIGLFIGIDMLFNGVTLLTLGLAARSSEVSE